MSLSLQRVTAVIYNLLTPLSCTSFIQTTDFAALLSPRLKIVNASGLPDDALREQLSSWTIDKAHCYDPNEEFRLRRFFESTGLLPIFSAFIRDLARWRFS